MKKIAALVVVILMGSMQGVDNRHKHTQRARNHQAQDRQSESPIAHLRWHRAGRKYIKEETTEQFQVKRQARIREAKLKACGLFTTYVVGTTIPFLIYQYGVYTTLTALRATSSAMNATRSWVIPA